MTRKTIFALVAATALTIAMAQDAEMPQEDHSMHDAPVSTGSTTIEDTGSEIVITTAPIDLPLMDHGEDHSGGHAGVFPDIGVVSIPAHGYLRGFDYEVLDGDGNVLSSRIVHHFNVIDPEHKELFLPIAQRLLAAGQETGRQLMPRLLFGVPVYVGQQLVVSTMLHNPTEQAHEDVTVRIKLFYMKVGRPWPLFEVYPFQVDVAFPAGDKSFDLPEGVSSKSWEGSPSMDGRIMVLGSHFHDLATHITLENVTTGETLWTGYPLLGEAGEVVGVTIGHAWRKLGIKVSRENVYRVTVFYDNDTGAILPEGGMGVVGGVFMPGASGAWPRVNTSNELYELDRRHFMREVRGTLDVITDGGGIVTADAAAAPAAEHIHN